MSSNSISATNKIYNTLYSFFSTPLYLAVGLAFTIESAMFGTWLSRIPAIKETLHLSEGALGMVLFGMPLGLLIMNPFSARIVNKLGAAKATVISGIFCCLAFIVPAFATDKYTLFTGLIFIGMGSAVLNVAVNTCVTILEEKDKVKIMATCHGMWSLGGMLSGFLASWIIKMGITTPIHVTTIAFLLITGLLLLNKTLSEIKQQAFEKSEAPKNFIAPNRELFLLICVGIFGMMAEGLAFDWSGVYLREVVHTSQETSALGFTLFALAMTIGRFTGDTFIPHIGEKKALIIGGIIAIFGLLLSVLFPHTYTTLLGFFLLGLGCSLTAPILFTASMRLPNVNPSAGLATYATFSFLGFLVGPPLIGIIAESFGLPFALLMIAVNLLIGILIVRQIRLN